MKVRKSNAPGLGDPYWYEWLVGIEYVVEMLAPESGIEWVTLQAPGISGLDDVVVRWAAGHQLFVQAKHSRSDDTFTLSDLLGPRKSGSSDSLLMYLASSWSRISIGTCGRCDVQIRTNRRLGDQPRGGTPSLTQVYTAIRSLQDARSLDEVSVDPTVQEVWRDEILPALSCIPQDPRKLEFLKRLEIRSEPEDIGFLTDRLTRRIQHGFDVNESRAEQLRDGLLARLREWVTSARGIDERITPERAMEAISLASDTEIGSHRLRPPAPFFEGRSTTAASIESAIRAGSTRVVFLTGVPGCGKTALVSHLANRREPIIDLRYHAYRPIDPENPLLPIDSGETVKVRSLWNDLLVQLRKLAKGHMAELRMPVCASALTPDALRGHVLRISSALAGKRGKPIVIAVDGIDHAARVSSIVRTFLESLPSPSQLPDGVRFLIAGQRPEDYPNYPIWLRRPVETVVRVDMPELARSDSVGLLRRGLPDASESVIGALSEVIYHRCQGHTLATVMAAREAEMVGGSVELLQERLDQRNLSPDVESYYESIWRSLLTGRSEVELLRLAALLALSPVRLTGDVLEGIFDSRFRILLDDLKALRPLVSEDDEGAFRTFHNDVSLFLHRKAQGERGLLSTTASALADFLMRSHDARAKHAAAHRLLSMSGRDLEVASIFTPRYVLEGYAVGQSLHALASQAFQSARALSRLSPSWDAAAVVACGICTLNQLSSTLEWNGERSVEADVAIRPSPGAVRLAEYRVLAASEWTPPRVSAALRDAESLLDEGQPHRALALLFRWFGGMTVLEVAKTIWEPPSSEGSSPNRDAWRKPIVDLGRVCARLESYAPPAPLVDDLSCEAEAEYFRGVLQVDPAVGTRSALLRRLARRTTCFRSDLQLFLERIACTRDSCRIALAVRHFADQSDGLSPGMLVRLAGLAMSPGCDGDRSKYGHAIKAKAASLVSGLERSTESAAYTEVLDYCWTAFSLAAYCTADDPGTVASRIMDAYRSCPRDPRADPTAGQLVHASACFGCALGVGASVRDRQASLGLDLLFRASGAKHPEMPEGCVRAIELLALGIELLSGQSVPFEHTAFTRISQAIESDDWPGPLLTSAWRLISRRGMADELRQFAERWVGDRGRVWELPVEDRFHRVSAIAALLRSSSMQQIAQQAEARFRWCSMGFRGHKDYSLGAAHSWAEALLEREPSCWQQEGLRLLAISSRAGELGDNRYETSIRRMIIRAAVRCGPAATASLLGCSPRTLAADEPSLMQALEEVELPGSSDHFRRALWALCCGTLAWKASADLSAISETRDAILASCSPSSRSALFAWMGNVAPAEADLRSDTSRSNRPQRVDDDAAPEVRTLESLVEALRVANGTRTWRPARLAAEALIQARPNSRADVADVISRALRTDRSRWSWEHDGRAEIYELLCSLVGEQRRWEAVLDLVARYDIEEPDDLWGLHANLEVLCRAHASASGFGCLQRGVERHLDMFELWISGDGRLPPLQLPTVAASTESDWPTVFAIALVQLLQSREQEYVQTALRGLSILMAEFPSTVSVALEHVDGSAELQRRLLMVADALLIRTGSTELSSWLRRQMESPRLDCALNAWLALRRFARSIGQLDPQWPEPGMRPSPIGILVPPGASFLLSPPQTVGLHTFSTNVLERIRTDVSASLGRPCEEVWSAFEAERSVNRPSALHADLERVSRGRDYLMRREDDADTLMEVLRRFERRGYFDADEILSLAHALTPPCDGDILLRTPRPFRDPGACPVDDHLDLAIDANRATTVLEAALAHELDAGCFLLGGCIESYSAKSAARLELNRVCYVTVGQKLDLPPSALNARCALLIDGSPRVVTAAGDGQVWLMAKVGGLLPFVQGLLDLCPTDLWIDRFGWTPSSQTPLIWERDGRRVAWLERWHGCRSDNWGRSRIHRQPTVTRWVCDSREWERATGLLAGPMVKRTSLRIERANSGD